MASSFDEMLQEQESEMWDDAVRSHQEQVAAAEPLATDKQASYLEALRDGKDTSSLSPEQRAWLADADFKTIPKRRASDVIGTLKELPWAPKDSPSNGDPNDRPELPVVPNGRYAIEDATDGALKFYSIKKGTHTTFVDVWASDARYPIKAFPTRLAILNAIAVDPVAAMKRFGAEIGKCGRCGRTLTDATSRAFGIGPDCREQMGI